MKITLLLLTLQFTAVVLLAQSPTPAIDEKPPLASGIKDLRDSRFYLVSLANSKFDQSDLSKTTFRSIDFSDVSITSANLTGAIITSSNLSNAQVSRCNLSGMKIDGVLVTDLQKAYAKAKKKQ
jgi:uncharacterized protein YjbI with pentapeptide repeats